MENILLLQNPHWDNKSYQNLIHRTVLESVINRINIRQIQVLLGIRRSGKSSLFRLIINELMKKVNPAEILYVNLDDPYFSDYKNNSKWLYDLMEVSEKITGKKPKYILLDEIQSINEWEKFIKSIYDNNLVKKIFVTGSNSSLLRGNYARLLSGRYIVNTISPFSLKELLINKGILTYKDALKNKSYIFRTIDGMIKNGSFPEIVLSENEEIKRDILLNYYETIILKDCAFMNKLRDIKTLNDLVYHIVSNSPSLFSYNSLAKVINSNENTIKSYINILEDSYLFKVLEMFSYSVRKQIKSGKKIYCSDNGFINHIAFRFSENKGKLFENFIFTEFIKQHKGDLYFYAENYECDFIMKNNNNLIAIQVCWELTAENRSREIKGIEETKKKFNIKKGIIVTYNQESLINESISVIPYWKMLFDDYLW
jgi:uncharacterized protein